MKLKQKNIILLLIILLLLSLSINAEDNNNFCLKSFTLNTYLYQCEDDEPSLCIFDDHIDGSCDDVVVCTRSLTSYCEWNNLGSCLFTGLGNGKPIYSSSYNNIYPGYDDNSEDNLIYNNVNACDLGCCIVEDTSKYYAFGGETVPRVQCEDYEVNGLNMQNGGITFKEGSCDNYKIDCSGIGDIIDKDFGESCCSGLSFFNYIPSNPSSKVMCYDPSLGKPVCLYDGTEQEGWYHSNDNSLIAIFNCDLGNYQEKCNDNDNGYNYYEYGFAEKDLIRINDNCLNSTHVQESVCVSDEPTTYIYKCPFGCSNGACIEQEKTCNDSDGGINYYSKGIVSKDDNEFNDFCIENNLTEFFCLNDEVQNTTTICLNGCNNGACNENILECAESDYGKNYYKFGITVYYDGYATTKQQDYCYDDTKLVEYYCDDSNELNSIIYNCPYGCDTDNNECAQKDCASSGDYVYFDSISGPIKCCDENATIKPSLIYSQYNVDNGYYSCLGDTKHKLIKGICSLDWNETCGDGVCDGLYEDRCTCFEDCGSSLSPSFCLDDYEFVFNNNPFKGDMDYQNAYNRIFDEYNCHLNPSEYRLLNACPKGTYMASGYNKFNYTCYTENNESLPDQYSCIDSEKYILKNYDQNSFTCEMKSLYYVNPVEGFDLRNCGDSGAIVIGGNLGEYNCVFLSDYARGICADTDSNNLGTKGTTSISVLGNTTEIKTDYCDENGKVIEHTCKYNDVWTDDEINATAYDCPSNNVCSDGICIDETAELFDFRIQGVQLINAEYIDLSSDIDSYEFEVYFCIDGTLSFNETDLVNTRNGNEYMPFSYYILNLSGEEQVYSLSLSNEFNGMKNGECSKFIVEINKNFFENMDFDYPVEFEFDFYNSIKEFNELNNKATYPNFQTCARDYELIYSPYLECCNPDSSIKSLSYIGDEFICQDSIGYGMCVPGWGSQCGDGVCSYNSEDPQSYDSEDMCSCPEDCSNIECYKNSHCNDNDKCTYNECSFNGTEGTCNFEEVCDSVSPYITIGDPEDNSIEFAGKPLDYSFSVVDVNNSGQLTDSVDCTYNFLDSTQSNNLILSANIGTLTKDDFNVEIIKTIKIDQVSELLRNIQCVDSRGNIGYSENYTITFIECTSDNDCGKDYGCDKNGICRETCSVTSDCDSGMKCSDGLCIPTCGDNIVDSWNYEECDGFSLNGRDCSDFNSFESGILLCTDECSYNTSGCITIDHCTNNVKDSDETDIDCGGSCGVCSTGNNCTENLDCASGFCSNGVCISTCGNSKLEGYEICDGNNLNDLDCLDFDSFTGGVLSCDSSCHFNVSSCEGGSSGVCGDNNVNVGEACDGTDLNDLTCEDFGFEGGILQCTDECSYNLENCVNPINGDNIIRGTEQCDGNNLNNLTCENFGYEGGVLTCSSNGHFNFTLCYRNHPCTTSNDCNDNTFCTTDACIDNECVFTAVENCIIYNCTTANPGMSLCSDGSCSYNCSITDTDFDTTCNNDSICDVKEGCACSDCDGEQSICSEGSVCSIETKSCICNAGMSLCSDGSCSYNCSITDTNIDTTCNNNGICDINEGCACSDCDDVQNICGNNSACVELGICGCLPGMSLCSDGSCSYNCSITDTNIDTTCNNNGICDLNESCACSDCDGNESLCVGGSICSIETKSCECPIGKTEVDGICLDEACIDHDSGINYYNSNYTEVYIGEANPPEIYYDVCINSTHLIEQYCSGTSGVNISKKCAFGCNNGACIKNEEGCDNGIQDNDETDVDCGGNCEQKCGPDESCESDEDCIGGNCNITSGTCWQPSLEVSYKLEPGWNLISVPIEPEDEDLEVIFDDLLMNDSAERVLNYENGIWKAYNKDPDIPSNLDKIEKGKAYWVKMISGGLLNIIGTYFTSDLDLNEEWNFIGVESLVNVTAGDYFGDQVSSIDKIYYYAINETGDKNLELLAEGNVTNEILEPGVGYWIYINQD